MHTDEGRRDPTRRRLLEGLSLAVPTLAWAGKVFAQANPSASAAAARPIPSSGEMLPLIGLGSWITFNVGNDPVAREACAEVMRAFFDAGGRMIDCSPMYGSSQEVIGQGLARIGRVTRVFAADKVWIASGARGPAQIEASRRHWNVPRFDLLQVHNLLDWEAHLPTLLLVVSGTCGAGWRLRSGRSSAGRVGRVGHGLLVFALLGQPGIGVLFDRSWRQAEVFGLAPDPTVLGTLGVLLLLRSGAAHGTPGAKRALEWMLWPIPLAWCLVSGATLWSMDAADALLMPGAALLAMFAAPRAGPGTGADADDDKLT